MYIFDKKRKKVKYCPCGKSNRDGKFASFIGYENKGYCHSCSRLFKPDESVEKNSFNSSQFESSWKEIVKQSASYISHDYLHQSLQHNKPLEEIAKNNAFIKYLLNIFSEAETKEVVKLYYIGTSKKEFRVRGKYKKGSNVFWQVGINNNIRTGKIMLYDESGKRIQNPNCITWVHKELNLDSFKLNQCFFGEHLLQSDLSKKVAIVESEKTAVVCHIYFKKKLGEKNNFIWLATGGKDGLTIDKCKVLKNRKVVLFPDIGAYELWQNKATVVKEIVEIKISDFLEVNATEVEKGFDLADYIERFLK